ncbi:IS66 family transposase [Maricaulis sp.]|uniref:IS66 family transposase n=1 Tax=Maricaulis sp. TaxID=1486257 RepID=UPI001B0101C2|nr:IS66 family transposase [Maricaulis sp.]MBO6798471.1 IS66 family transposase [Maricaulis sp.]
MRTRPSNTSSDLPDDIDALKGAVGVLERELYNRDLLIEKLKHQLAGLQRHQFGSRSESLDQLEMRLEDEEIAQASAQAEAEAEAEADEAPAKPKRNPLPAHLPRTEKVLSPGEACLSCGGDLKRLGEDVTEELEYVPGYFVVNRIVRPRMACSCCERMHQAALPSRPIEKGRPGPGLLSHVIISKYGDHLPLYRQSQIYAREGIELERSTLAGWVGQSARLLEPLAEAIGRHVRQGQAIFADDTPMKMLAPGKGRTATGRMWAYVRDEHGWSGSAPPAAHYRFSTDRKGEHPADHLSGYRGFMHADGYAGFNRLYDTGQIIEVACMAHIRRKFVDVQTASGSAIAQEAVERIARLYAIENAIRGKPPDQRAAARQARSRPEFEALDAWLQTQLTRVSGKTPLAAAIRYALTRMKKLEPWLMHGTTELDNNAAERAMRPIALGRKNFLFAGSEDGGKSAAIAYTLIETAKLNGLDPQTWLTDVLANIADTKITHLEDLMPWSYAQRN